VVGPLAPLFNESVDQVIERERTSIDRLLNSRNRRVVIVGAGTLGCRASFLLNQLGCDVLGFTDNNEANWTARVEGLPVLSPAEAASSYGDSALFLVTIWNDRHWFRETFDQLTRLGCSLISCSAVLALPG
jgi:hypothetical protein